MTESRWTAKLLNDVRRARPNAVVVKLWQGPFSTAGVPDFFVNEDGRTSWCEVKLTSSGKGKSRRGEKQLFVPLQLETCRRMKAWYLIWAPPLKKGWLFRADELTDLSAWMHEPGFRYAELVERIARTII